MKNKVFTIITMAAMAATLMVGCGTQSAGIAIPQTVNLTAGAADYMEAPAEAADSSDLDGAKQKAEGFFAENFEGCVLNSLEYVDTYSAEDYAQIAASYGADEAVIFTSSFYVPQDCENMTLNPGMTYEDYTYTITRNAGEDWVIQDCGMQ